MIHKANVRRDMTYTRRQMRSIEEAMRWGDWQTVSDISLELSGIWGTICQEALERHEGVDND